MSEVMEHGFVLSLALVMMACVIGGARFLWAHLNSSKGREGRQSSATAPFDYPLGVDVLLDDSVYTRRALLLIMMMSLMGYVFYVAVRAAYMIVILSW